MAKIVNQEERAFRAWNVLIDYAEKKETITYKELGDKLGVHHRTCRYFLDYIQNFCIEERLPPLTILVVNQKGELGNGFIAWDAKNPKEGMKKVFSFNWANLDNPFTYASNGSTERELANELVKKSVLSKDLFSKVKVRGIVQSIFRKALLEAYGFKCSFCGINIPVLLEAAHIIPWSICSDEEKLNINNGILLCSNHHKMFDANLILIDENYIIHLHSSIKSKINGRKIRLPNDKDLYPAKELLQRKGVVVTKGNSY